MAMPTRERMDFMGPPIFLLEYLLSVLGKLTARHNHIIDVNIARKAPFPCEWIELDPLCFQRVETGLFKQSSKVRGGDKPVPVVRAGRQPAQDILGTDLGQSKRLERLVECGND